MSHETVVFGVIEGSTYTHEDYRALRDKYEARALDAMARLDRLERGSAARANES